MPPDIQYPQLPFLTREMLSYGNSSPIGLSLDIVTSDSNTILIRGMTRSGAFTYSVTPAAASAIETFNFPLTDVPIFVGIYSVTGSIEPVTHATLHFTIDSTRVGIFCQGIVNTILGLTWPSIQPAGHLQQIGAIRIPSTTNPPANTEISETVPNNQIWEIISIGFQLTTDANAADRTVRILFTDPTGTVIRRSAAATQQASETQDYTIIPGGTTADVVTNSLQEIGIPEALTLIPGTTITTVTTNRQAGDNYTAPRIVVFTRFQAFI